MAEAEQEKKLQGFLAEIGARLDRSLDDYTPVPPAATAAERDAAAAVLEQAIAAARPFVKQAITGVPPAYRATAGRILTSWHRGWFTRERITWHPLTGLRLSGSARGPLMDGYRPFVAHTRGSFGGAQLWLLEDGALAEVQFTGWWKVPLMGEVIGEWTGEPRTVTSREAMDRWSLGVCLERLTTALAELEQAEQLEKDAVSRERAERQAALERLKALQGLAK